MSAIWGGITGGQPVSVLRETDRPDQGVVLLRGWICAVIQAADKWSVSMAKDSAGTSAVGRTQFPLADGGTKNRAAKSNSEEETEGFILKEKLDNLLDLWYNLSVK